jgi:hypothetical protein
MKKSIYIFLLLVLASLLSTSPAKAQTATLVCKSTDWIVDKINGEVRIFHKVGNQYAQYGVIHLRDSYFRLNYGPGSEWGTSVVLMPYFLSGGQYYQKNRVKVYFRIVNTQHKLTVKGTNLSLNTTVKVTVSHPTGTSISAHVTASVIGTVFIDSKPGEAFKPVTLSSMHISSTKWDAKRACVGTQCFSIPSNGWVIPPTQIVTSTNFRLVGGTSAWKTNAPTIVINSLNLSRRITGWVTYKDPADPQSLNEDNVGFWAAASKLLSSWSYNIIAKHP